jgi:hypothetical protein
VSERERERERQQVRERETASERARERERETERRERERERDRLREREREREQQQVRERERDSHKSVTKRERARARRERESNRGMNSEQVKVSQRQDGLRWARRKATLAIMPTHSMHSHTNLGASGGKICDCYLAISIGVKEQPVSHASFYLILLHAHLCFCLLSMCNIRVQHNLLCPFFTNSVHQ